MPEKLHEECGLFGIYDMDGHDVPLLTYYALFALQHRGQESCGIAVCDDGILSVHKDVGLVNKVFDSGVIESARGARSAIGHVRYGTTGIPDRVNAQPLVVRHIKGSTALAHNGNLTNAYELRQEFEMNNAIFHTTSDTEVISYLITRERTKSVSTEEAVSKAMNYLKGAYCLAVLSPTKLIVARDPIGFHPLCMGKIGNSYVFASETCALDAIGATFVKDVEPGEIIVVSETGVEFIKDHCGEKKKAICVFEYIYFARPDSIIDGTSVHVSRQKAGSFLAKEHPADADVVMGVPDTGIDAAIGFSRESGIPYGLGFVKNKYIARTFIHPVQKTRENQVRIKLNPIKSTVAGKRVVLIDDSIVRGTTIARIIGMLRTAGAKEVHVRVSAPPFLHPCYFGTDIDSSEMLIANNNSIDEIRQVIDADSLGYLSVENVTKLTDDKENVFCAGCFTGKYPSEVPKYTEKYKFSRKISEKYTNKNK
jgi:amidophosphoribosyltransferase